MPLSSQRSTAKPKPGEGLIQSAGYTHLLQIGSAADLPTLTSSPVWRKVSHLQETFGTIKDYLFDHGNLQSGLTEDDEVSVTDTKDPTTLAFLGVQQILAGKIPQDLSTLRALISSLGKPMDDRKLQLEKVVGFLATSGKARHDGPNRIINGLQGQFINLLWNDLSHPPTVTLNPKHRFRTADGRDNNLTGLPLLGAAAQAYSRSVKPLHPVAPYIAEPEDMFDAILRRPAGYGGFIPHPAGISSLLFAFANIIIHDLFWSNPGEEVQGPTPDTNSNQYKYQCNRTLKTREVPESRWQNLTSSYLSLDPLYGVNQLEQNSVRDTSQLGRGLLYNDTFASSRLLVMPPASCGLLVLFSRNHNRVAKKLLELNECGTWTHNFESLTPEQLQRQDDEIFGTARHVNCGYYVGMILHDYLPAILNTIKEDSDWVLDPRMKIKSMLGKTPKATGNSVTVEFNLIYRWHAPISWSQTQWLEKMMSKVLPSRDWDAMTGATLGQSTAILKKELNATNGIEPRYWKLSKYEVDIQSHGPPVLVSEGVYEREAETGKFRDEDIARILKDATHEIAGAFGARHTPAVLRWVECQGMRTARDVWKTCTLNEFRAFLGLKEFESFQEWNSNPEVASAMEDLVGHPSNIPLHVGLHGEEAKTPMLGAGLCPNYTNARAILSDAVALVRGDRFYTDSATAETMTDWGFRDCQSDVQRGAYGGLLEKLIQKNLPNQYAFNDYALLLPFTVPKHTQENMQRISSEKALNYALNPSVPAKLGFEHVTKDNLTFVFESSDTSLVEVERMSELFGLPHMNSNIKLVYKSIDLVRSQQDQRQYETYLKSRIQQCSAKRSPVSNDLTLDITRDVTNPLISGWLAHIFGLVETGIHSEQMLLCALSDIYSYLTESPQMTYKSRTCARVAASGLAWQFKYHIQAASSSRSLCELVKKGASILTVGALDMLEGSIRFLSGQHFITHTHVDSKAFYQALRAVNDAQTHPLSVDELAADCLRAVSTLAYTIVNGTAHALDHLIPPSDSSSSSQLEETSGGTGTIFEIPSDYQTEPVRAYLHQALESARVNHWHPQLRGLVVKSEHKDRKGEVSMILEQNPVASFTSDLALIYLKFNSNINVKHPIGVIDHTFLLDRDLSEYTRLLDVEGHCLPSFSHILPMVMKEVLSLPNVRRAPGRQGLLDKIIITGNVACIPTMHIRYDGASRLLN